MKPIKRTDMTIDELVAQFVEIAVAQERAILYDDNAKFKKLYLQMDAIEHELKRRHGDQRRVLLKLYQHPNMQVRLKAALSTLAIEPKAARATLEAIANSGWQPQCADAGMALWNLDRGVFKPT